MSHTFGWCVLCKSNLQRTSKSSQRWLSDVDENFEKPLYLNPCCKYNIYYWILHLYHLCLPILNIQSLSGVPLIIVCHAIQRQCWRQHEPPNSIHLCLWCSQQQYPAANVSTPVRSVPVPLKTVRSRPAPSSTIRSRPAPSGGRLAPFHGINRCIELSVAVNGGVAGFLQLGVQV